MMSCDRRLLKDLKTLHKANNPLFNVAPSEEDMREWHVNFFTNSASSFGSLAVHAVFTFPETYPRLPPKARFSSDLCYKFGAQTTDGELCLSILGNFADIHDEWNSSSAAWSPGYSMHDVLLNIYTVLLNPEDHSSEDRATIGHAAAAARCACGHDGSKGSTWLPQPLEQAPAQKPTPSITIDDEAAEEEAVAPALSTALDTCDGKVEAAELEETRFAIRCYTSQCTLDEMLTEPDSDAVFGFGLILEPHANGGGLYKATSPCEYMSHEAWQDGLRASIYNQALEYFLPLYLTPEHYARAEPIRRELFSSLATKLQLRCYEVEHKLITSLLAHLVVSALQARIRETTEGGVTLSTRMVEGYFQLWRLAKAMCKDNWLLQDALSTRVARFLQNPTARSKKHESSLGELYAAVAFTNHTWSECRDAIIEESGVRQVKWMLKEYPELVSGEMTDMSWRWNVSSEATRVSRGFQAFNKYFLAHVVQRASPEAVLHSADARFGVPAPALAESILQACIKASELATWREYFEWMEYDCLTEEAALAYLDSSLERSRLVHYHGADLDPLMSSRQQAAPEAPAAPSRAAQDMDWRARDVPDPAVAAAAAAAAARGPNGYVPPHQRAEAGLQQGHRPPAAPLARYVLPQHRQQAAAPEAELNWRGRRPQLQPEAGRAGFEAPNWRT